MKLSTLYKTCLVLAVVMLITVFPWPYGFYVFVRFFATIVFAFMAYSFYCEGRFPHAIIAGVLALLFQPFVKVALGREIWQVVDVIVGIGLIGFIIWDVKHPSLNTQQTQPSGNGNASNNGYDVFISYATRDYFDDRGNVIPGNVVSQVKTALSNAGISYWIDKKRLMGGVQFSSEIAKQIKNAKIFLFVSSANSNSSQWTMNEIATASTYGKTIIPFLADHTPYDSSIMIYIAGIHYIDYASNPSRAINDLVNAVKSQI